MNKLRLRRRDVLAGAIAIGLAPSLAAGTAEAREGFRVSLSDAAWQQRLGAASMTYRVLRREATEAPGSSPLLKEKRNGLFLCAGCANPLFSSRTKYESGTGWPSFWAPLARALGSKSDRTLGMPRTEVHCATCGGHLGHVFDDGPRPTGKRYCINGAALRFRPAKVRS